VQKITCFDLILFFVNKNLDFMMLKSKTLSRKSEPKQRIAFRASNLIPPLTGALLHPTFPPTFGELLGMRFRVGVTFGKGQSECSAVPAPRIRQDLDRSRTSASIAPDLLRCREPHFDKAIFPEELSYSRCVCISATARLWLHRNTDTKVH
jgi:hypothetical protein